MNEPERRTDETPPARLDGQGQTETGRHVRAWGPWVLAGLVYVGYLWLAVTYSPSLVIAIVLAALPALRLLPDGMQLGTGFGVGWLVGVLSMPSMPRPNEEAFVNMLALAVTMNFTAQMLALAARRNQLWLWEIGVLVGFPASLLWVLWVR